MLMIYIQFRLILVLIANSALTVLSGIHTNEINTVVMLLAVAGSTKPATVIDWSIFMASRRLCVFSSTAFIKTPEHRHGAHVSTSPSGLTSLGSLAGGVRIAATTSAGTAGTR